MSFRASGSGLSGRLALGGKLTIENAGRIRAELIKAFQESDRVVLEVMEDVVADVSFMQILCSAKQTSLIQKKSFEVDWSAAQGVRQFMEHAGYNFDQSGFPDAGHDRRSVSGGPNE